jgi:hypothetical protein
LLEKSAYGGRVVLLPFNVIVFLGLLFVSVRMYTTVLRETSMFRAIFSFVFVKDVHGPENKLIIVYPNLFYHSVFIKIAHIIHLVSFSNFGLLLFLSSKWVGSFKKLVFYFNTV